MQELLSFFPPREDGNEVGTFEETTYFIDAENNCYVFGKDSLMCNSVMPTLVYATQGVPFKVKKLFCSYQTFFLDIYGELYYQERVKHLAPGAISPIYHLAVGVDTQAVHSYCNYMILLSTKGLLYTGSLNGVSTVLELLETPLPIIDLVGDGRKIALIDEYNSLKVMLITDTDITHRLNADNSYTKTVTGFSFHHTAVTFEVPGKVKKVAIGSNGSMAVINFRGELYLQGYHRHMGYDGNSNHPLDFDPEFIEIRKYNRFADKLQDPEFDPVHNDEFDPTNYQDTEPFVPYTEAEYDAAPLQPTPYLQRLAEKGKAIARLRDANKVRARFLASPAGHSELMATRQQREELEAEEMELYDFASVLRLEPLPFKVSQVAVGETTTVIISDSGELYYVGIYHTPANYYNLLIYDQPDSDWHMEIENNMFDFYSHTKLHFTLIPFNQVATQIAVSKNAIIIRSEEGYNYLAGDRAYGYHHGLIAADHDEDDENEDAERYQYDTTDGYSVICDRNDIVNPVLI